MNEMSSTHVTNMRRLMSVASIYKAAERKKKLVLFCYALI